MPIVRWDLKEAGCGEHTNPRANLWSDGQKSHIRLYMGVSLRDKIKPDSYTEPGAVNAADRWRKRNVWYPGRSVRKALKKGNHYREVMLSVQKSAEVIVAEKKIFSKGPNQ